MTNGSWVFWGLTAGVVGYVVVTYNALVRARNAFRNAFAQIDVQLRRRYELIPNLVEAARAYLQHERGTLQAVTEARDGAARAARAASAHPEDPGAIGGLERAEGLLGAALGRFQAVVESYPDLRASETVSQLMEELASTENRVAFARQAFNDGVMRYNNRREQFPANLVAGLFNFRPARQLDIGDPAARSPVRVELAG